MAFGIALIFVRAGHRDPVAC